MGQVVGRLGIPRDLADHGHAELVGDLASAGMSVLLVEQQLARAAEVAERVTVLDYGRVALTCPAAEVRADPGPAEALLSITHDRTPTRRQES